MVGESDTDEDFILVGEGHSIVDDEPALTGEGGFSRKFAGNPSSCKQQCTERPHYSYAELVPFDPALPALHAYLGGKRLINDRHKWPLKAGHMV